MKTIKSLLATAVIVAAGITVYAQKTVSPWQKINESSISPGGTRYIKPASYLTYQLDVDLMRSQLNAAKRLTDPSYVPVYIQLPDENGQLTEFLVNENTTMSEGLAAQFPDIRAFDGTSTDGRGYTVKLDLTLQGFHAMIMRPGKYTVFIDPYAHLGDQRFYIIYDRSHFTTDKTFSCDTDAPLTEIKETAQSVDKSYGDCQKRTYRLALSATAEYTAFHGGTVGQAQSAQVTTMNRVNGVYMREMAITMTIIANNNILIFTNAGSDPFTNGNPGSMINQNQTYVNTNIGSANYDIGHVFGTNSGGLAGLGVVCSGSNKARGVTGSSAPINDPFDIDYVAHEMGHQFDGNHTFRDCDGNENGSTAFEPGSGSTIMAYAGICGATLNVQSNSDDYFHGVTMQEIGDFITGGSHTCPVVTAIPTQSSPEITSVTSGNMTIPISTPFSLTATATDADGDPLTYCWEQMNNQNSTQPPLATAVNGPNFRSFDPTTNPTRYFPSIDALTSGGPFTWERLPSVARTMNFRVMVRDNGPDGGCNDNQDLTVTVSAVGGPFILTYPSASGISWQGLSQKTVTWDVANTTAAPISCANVNILLSIDGGETFTTLLSNTPNDGTETITVPDTPSDEALIIVQAGAQTFFDVSNSEFEIVGSTDCYEADVPAIAGATAICAGGNTTLTISGGDLHDATGWRWYSGSCNGTVIATGTSINISTPGSYFVGGFGGCTVGDNCRSFSVTQVNVNTNTNQSPNPPYTLAADLTGATSYQWIDCGNGNAIVDGATGQTYTPQVQLGQFAVIITTNGCSDTSACMTYDIVGLNDLNKLNLQLFPNPTNGIVTLKFDAMTEVSQLSVTDVTGRLIRLHEDISASSMELDLSEEGKGVYFLNVRVGETVQTMRIVKE